MSLGNFLGNLLGNPLGKVLTCLAVLIFACEGFAAPKAEAKSAAKAPVKTIKRFAVGAGFMSFSEQIKVVESGALDKGFANYSGAVFFAEHTWTQRRMIYQGALGIAAGKATAGGFASVSYPDAGRRSWTFAFFEATANYRLNPRFSAGAGLIGGTRSADFKSEANPALTVLQLNKTIYAPEFVVRWNVSRGLTLVQSIATPDFRGTTMWRWTAQFNL